MVRRTPKRKAVGSNPAGDIPLPKSFREVFLFGIKKIYFIHQKSYRFWKICCHIEKNQKFFLCRFSAVFVVLIRFFV